MRHDRWSYVGPRMMAAAEYRPFAATSQRMRMAIQLLCTVTLASACEPGERTARDRAEAEAAMREAEAHAKADATFDALTPTEHLEHARSIVQRNHAADPLATAASRRAELDEAERHLHAIPATAPESTAAAELAASLATERPR